MHLLSRPHKDIYTKLAEQKWDQTGTVGSALLTVFPYHRASGITRGEEPEPHFLFPLLLESKRIDGVRPKARLRY